MLFDYIQTHKELIIIIISLSIVSIIAALIFIPMAIINLSPDYFNKRRVSMYNYKHPFIRYSVFVLKNIGGYLLIITGLILLLTPGQGILLMIMGFLLINFPGKKRIEYRIFTNKRVISAINAIRHKAGKDDIDFTKQESYK